MSRSLPIFRPEPPRTRTTRVVWVPADPASTDKPCISVGDSTVPASPVWGLTLKVDDEVSVTRIGQTYRIDTIVRRPTTTTATAASEGTSTT